MTDQRRRRPHAAPACARRTARYRAPTDRPARDGPAHHGGPTHRTALDRTPSPAPPTTVTTGS